MPRLQYLVATMSMPLIWKSLGKVERHAVEFHMMSNTLAGMFISSTWGIKLTWCPAVILFQTPPFLVVCELELLTLHLCDIVSRCDPIPATRDLHFVQRLSWNLPSSSPRVWQHGETWLPVTVGEKICSCNYCFQSLVFPFFFVDSIYHHSLQSLYLVTSEEAGLISQHIQIKRFFECCFKSWDSS